MAPDRDGEQPTNSETTSVDVGAPGASAEPKQGPEGLPAGPPPCCCCCWFCWFCCC